MSFAWLVVAFLAAPPESHNATAPAGFRRLVDAVPLDDGRQLAVVGQRSGTIAIVETASGTIEQEIAVGERLEAIAAGVVVPAAEPRTTEPRTAEPRTTEPRTAEPRTTEPRTTPAKPRPILAAVDSARNELAVLSPAAGKGGQADSGPGNGGPGAGGPGAGGPDNGAWHVARRFPVVRWPISVCVARSGRIATVAGLWSRCWQVVPLDPTDAGQARTGTSPESSSVPLPFAPRLQVELPDGRFLVVDAFGGQFALLDADPPRLLAAASWPIHNIRGLSVAPDGLSVVLAHQTLNERLPIRREAILAGQLIRNGLSHVPIAALLTSRRFEGLDELAGTGNPAAEAIGSRGAGDPAGLAWWGERRVVALSGLSECLSLPAAGGSAAARIRFATGARPLRVVALPALGRVAVVGSLDDSLTLIDPSGRAASRRVTLSPQMSPTPQDRGERAFFDARLSAGGFLSCHSCHSEAHTNGLLSDTLGDETDGAPKRVPTLLGTGMTYRWGWNGAQQSLHDQVLKSIDQTMGGQPRFQDGTDMVAYFHTLAPPPPLEPAAATAATVAAAVAAATAAASPRELGAAVAATAAASPREPAAADTRLLERGRDVFTARGCGNCHVPPLVYASHESYDVGLSDERGLRKFNPPSLRGVSQAGRWLHDGRAGSLESVFRDHTHPHESRWSDDELAALLRFLRSL